MKTRPEHGRITLNLNVTAPSFELKDVFGRMIDLQKYKGKKVFIAFFKIMPVAG